MNKGSDRIQLLLFSTQLRANKFNIHIQFNATIELIIFTSGQHESINWFLSFSPIWVGTAIEATETLFETRAQILKLDSSSEPP